MVHPGPAPDLRGLCVLLNQGGLRGVAVQPPQATSPPHVVVAAARRIDRRDGLHRRRDHRRERHHPVAPAPEHPARDADQPSAAEPDAVRAGGAHLAIGRPGARRRRRQGARDRAGGRRRTEDARPGILPVPSREQVGAAADRYARRDRRGRTAGEHLARMAAPPGVRSLLARVLPGAQARSEPAARHRRAGAGQHHRRVGGRRRPLDRRPRRPLPRCRLRLDAAELLRGAVRRDVARRRLCGDPDATGWDPDGTLSGRRADRREGARLGPGEAAKCKVRRLQLHQPGRPSGAHRGGLSPG